MNGRTEVDLMDCSVSYIRNTHDPILFYRGKNLFSLNTVKCLILNFYSVRVARCLKLRNMNTNYLCGVYYSSQMDCRIKDVLPIFSRKAEKKGLSIELLFHPGTMLENELTAEFQKQGFNDFHISDGRKTEFCTVQSLAESKIR